MSLKKLQKDYYNICNEYIDAFIKKQSMSFNGWVGNTIGGIACCNDFYFNFQDIVCDINTKQPKGAIIDWYYSNLDEPEKSINYYSYTKGLRITDLK